MTASQPRVIQTMCPVSCHYGFSAGQASFEAFVDVAPV
jgi:hypothetical protein